MTGVGWTWQLERARSKVIPALQDWATLSLFV